MPPEAKKGIPGGGGGNGRWDGGCPNGRGGELGGTGGAAGGCWYSAGSDTAKLKENVRLARSSTVTTRTRPTEFESESVTVYLRERRGERDIAGATMAVSTAHIHVISDLKEHRGRVAAFG